MNIKIIILIYIIVSTPKLFSQTGWNKIPVGLNESIISLEAIDTSYIFCGTDSGKVLKSVNGGLNWQPTTTGISTPISGLSFLNRNDGYFASMRSIYKTTNSGVNWIYLNSVPGDYLTYIKYFTPTKAVVIGFTIIMVNQYIFCCNTTNAGLNWNYISVTNGTLSNRNNVFFYDSTYGYVVFNNKLSKTYDGGSHWYTNTLPDNYNLLYNFTNPNTGYIYTDIAKVKKTTNGGLNFSTIYLNGIYLFYGGYFINNNIGYIAGLNGPIQCTTNGGLDWEIQYNGFINDIQLVKFYNDRLGFAYGKNGTLFRTNDGGGLYIGISKISDIIPDDFSLSQNYPNPFNPVTNISFDVSEKSDVKLVVYDLLGREIAELVNDNLNPARYKIDWDASNYSSGVYFYKLTAGDYTETKKMLLIK